MKHYQRHTKLTHHILEEEEYDSYYWYGYDDGDISDWQEEDYMFWDTEPVREVVNVIYRNRWFKHPLFKQRVESTKYYKIDLMSVYSKERKRDIILEQLLNEDVDSGKNTIEKLINGSIV